jgi:hypothetical protein
MQGDQKQRLKLFQEAGEISDAQSRIGTFKPLFGHDPADGYMPIYPTVPDDIGRMILVARGLFVRITAKLSA